jgi:hypothetical protein
MRFTSRGLTASQSLRHLLRDLGVTWIVRDEALVITAPEKAEEDQEIRVYPVADLVCDSDPCGQLVPNDGKDFSTLIDLIESTISPDSWESVGGPGSIEPCRNADVLAVSAGPQTHEEIEHLLTRLRAEMAPQPTEPAKSTKETASSGAARSAARAADEDRDGAAAEKDLRFVVYFVPSPADWPPKAPQIESEKKEAKPADGASPQTEKKEAKPDDRAAPAPGAPKSSQPSPNLWNMGGLGGGTGLRGLQSPPIPEGRLLEMIRELVEPNSWAATRGVYARAAPGRLIIRHTAAVHRQIHALLSQLAIKFHTSAGFSSDDAGRTGGFQGPTAWFDAQLPPTGP